MGSDCIFFLYTSKLTQFARVSNLVVDFNTRNKILTTTLLKSRTPLKVFSKLYRRLYDLILNFNVELKSRLKQGLTEPECSESG